MLTQSRGIQFQQIHSGKNPGYPEGVEGTKRAFASFEEAKRLVTAGKAKEAISMLEEIRDSLPDGQRPAADYYKALALVSIGEYQEASQATSVGALRGAMDPLIALVESEKGNSIGKGMILSCRSLIQSNAPEAQKKDRDDSKISDRSAALFGIANEYPESELADNLLLASQKESPDSIVLANAVLANLSEDIDPESWIEYTTDLKTRRLAIRLRLEIVNLIKEKDKNRINTFNGDLRIEFWQAELGFGFHKVQFFLGTTAGLGFWPENGNYGW